MKEISKSFELKHENLISQENSIKENLQIEVTKIKEKFENFLTECNEKIRIGDKINKGIIKLQNEKEKNIIKVISYISKMNKLQNEMDKLFKELIKNSKISFLEKKNIIKFEDYYFNGIQTPKDIEIKNIDFSSAEVHWKIDDIKINNINNNEIIFNIEIKKENSPENFIQIYKGKQKNYKINNLEYNTHYLIRINCIYNNLQGNFSEIYKFKTKNNKSIDSIILQESGRKEEFENKINEWIKYEKLELIIFI